MNNQLNLLRTIILLSIIAIYFSSVIHAQDLGAAKIYRNQFLESRINVNSMLERVSSLRVETLDNQTEINLQEEIFSLTKLIHNLGEEALRSNNDSLRRKKIQSKTMLLINQGCIAMDYVLSALSSYIDVKNQIIPSGPGSLHSSP